MPRAATVGPMQRLTIIAARAVRVALALAGLAGSLSAQAFLATTPLASSTPHGPVDPSRAIATRRALDSLRTVMHRLTVREAELSAAFALLHRDAVAVVLDRDGRLTSGPVAAPRSLEEERRAMRLRRDLFFTALAAGAWANAMWRIDPDDYRGPRPAFDRYSGYHFTAGVTLEQLGFVMRVPAPWRVAGVCLAAEVFEHTQGYVDQTDAAVGCSGASLSALARRLLVERQAARRAAVTR